MILSKLVFKILFYLLVPGTENCIISNLNDTDIICSVHGLSAGSHTVKVLIPGKGYANMNSGTASILR